MRNHKLRCEHPLDSWKRRSNFAGVSTLGVGYALRWYLNHRPNFYFVQICDDFCLTSTRHSLIIASWQPPDSHSKTFAGSYFWILCVNVSILVCWPEKMCLGKKCFLSWQLVDSLLTAWQHSDSQGVFTLWETKDQPFSRWHKSLKF